MSGRTRASMPTAYGAREVSQLWGPGAAVPSVCTDGACF